MKNKIKKVLLTIIDAAMLPFGIIIMGMGLWMYQPWIAFTIVGAIITAIALYLEIKG